jgi:hypothetical protein
MRADLFDFDLPPELIAQEPARPRDAARLLVVGESLDERTVRDLPDLLRPGDLLVLNDTRVLPTRFAGRRGAVPVEVTLVERAGEGAWWALARPGKRLRPGDPVELAKGLGATVEGRTRRAGSGSASRWTARICWPRSGPRARCPCRPTSIARAAATRATGTTTSPCSRDAKARSRRRRLRCTSHPNS